ncbi:hypothetical protein QE440_004733 [Pseudomonas psychrotolerans]|uniref:Uncharacterized protein n=1 Tax=Pseudomonas oryzihabitans TaxID=47885 RepID=A0AAJ2BUU1_9PSED|nr:hypothetical protein [Pseudomonas psychrotolerans]
MTRGASSGCKAQREQRKGDEGEAEDQQMQAPMGDAGDQRLARQLGAVQEEQQADGDVGHHVGDLGGKAPAGQDAGEDHRGDQQQGEVVRHQAGSSHGLSRVVCR